MGTACGGSSRPGRHGGRRLPVRAALVPCRRGPQDGDRVATAQQQHLVSRQVGLHHGCRVTTGPALLQTAGFRRRSAQQLRAHILRCMQVTHRLQLPGMRRLSGRGQAPEQARAVRARAHLQRVHTIMLCTLGVFSRATSTVPSIIRGPAGTGRSAPACSARTDPQTTAAGALQAARRSALCLRWRQGQLASLSVRRVSVLRVCLAHMELQNLMKPHVGQGGRTEQTLARRWGPQDALDFSASLGPQPEGRMLTSCHQRLQKPARRQEQ